MHAHKYKLLLLWAYVGQFCFSGLTHGYEPSLTYLVWLVLLVSILTVA